MRLEYVALIALLSVSSCFIYADAQDIFFPGETERPPRYPISPNNPGSRNTLRPNPGPWNTPRPNNPGSRTTQTPNNPGQGQQQNNTIDGITQEQYNTCVEACKFTSEYNPQCGSDGVIYQNPGALNCAVYCGNPIQNLGRAPCATTTAAPTTTTQSTSQSTRRRRSTARSTRRPTSRF